MIKIKSGLKKKEIVAIFDGKTVDGVEFNHIETKGLIMSFDHSGDSKKAKNVAKDTIMKESWGRALYFSVEEA